MQRIIAAILLGVTLIATQFVAAAENRFVGSTDMQALRDAVKADKKGLVASTLQLTDAEAKRFWPLYDTYQRALATTSRQRAVVVEDLLSLDKPPSDLYARTLAAELIAADENEIKARRKLQNDVMRALPAKKAARYMQLESKIRAYQAYDLASALPLLK